MRLIISNDFDTPALRYYSNQAESTKLDICSRNLNEVFYTINLTETKHFTSTSTGFSNSFDRTRASLINCEREGATNNGHIFC